MRYRLGRKPRGPPMVSAMSSKSGPAHAHTLSFPQLQRQIATLSGESIFHSARRHGVRIVGACGGRGTCGTCVVQVVEGEVEQSLQTPAEAAPLREAPGARRWVRACLVRARSDCTVEVAPRSLAPVVRADVEGGAEEELVLDSLLHAHEVRVAAASLADNLGDAERLLRGLAVPVTALDIAAARQLPQRLRAGAWALSVRLRASELIGCAPLGSPSLGLAVDLGTTNVAAFLIDLTSGRRLASLGIENPQVAWGADVISRINHAAKDQAAADELRAAALEAINALAHDLCQAVGAGSGDIVDAVICANTAMHHLLLGLPVFQLGRAPFVPALRQGLDLKARELGLAACAGAYVHLVPNVGGFVGGDHVAALLATESRWSAATTALLMDIGTNTEISLIHQGRLLSASCPSGPALEGGHISCGMRAAEGAIERVSLADGELALQVIGGVDPVGLCGSGVLDALAAMRRAGIIGEGGRLAADHPRVKLVEGKRVAELAPGVHVTQDDVRAVQLAKAAIRSGVELLLEQAGLAESDIECLIIAGAFGAYIDVASGIATGLLPELPPQRFVQVGNAAGVGVRQMLASQRARARADSLAAQCRYIELSTLKGFQKTFLKHIGFHQSTARDAP